MSSAQSSAPVAEKGAAKDAKRGPKKEKGPKKPAPKRLLKKKVPLPESLLKKRRDHQKALRRRTELYRKDITRKDVTQAVAVRRAAKYAVAYRETEAELSRQRRKARKHGDFFVEAEPKVAFVIRIRGILGISPKPRKVLQLLRLRQINNGVFIRVNKATTNMLRLAEPYLAWGYPDLKTVRTLLYKRGFAKIGKSRIPLADNALIEKHLGKYDIVCVEDLVHQLYTCGEYFPEVAKFFWPFKLSNAKGGYKDKGRHFNEGGDFGNREDLINELIQKMV